MAVQTVTVTAGASTVPLITVPGAVQRTVTIVNESAVPAYVGDANVTPQSGLLIPANSSINVVLFGGDTLYCAAQSLVATVTNAVGSAGTVTYTAANSFTAGQIVTVTGVNPAAYNLTNVTIATASGTQFTVTNAATGAYVSGGVATVNRTTPIATLIGGI